MMLIKPLERVIEKLDDLPRERQKIVAEVLEMVITDDEDLEELSEEELRLIDVGLAQLDRGEVATDAEVKAVFDKYSTSLNIDRALQDVAQGRTCSVSEGPSLLRSRRSSLPN